MGHRRYHGLPALAAAAALSLAACAAVSPETATQRIGGALEAAVRGHADRAGASVLVHSDTLGLHVLVRADPAGPDAFHVASIGKVFTAVLVGRLIDAGVLRLDEPVRPLLPPGTLDGLFVVHGTDHQAEVTVDHLLSHTSGIADYFDDPASGGKPVSTLIVEDPGHSWIPAELLDFTRNQQAAVGTPGQAYHYSDTGYIVLGLLVERLTGAPFATVLDRQILTPLGMDRTWMPWRGSPRSGSPGPLRPAWLHGSDVSRSASITADWAGGGMASTEEDLLKFQQALWSGRLLSAPTLAALQSFDHVFQKGIWYGKGLMQLRFGEFFFLLGSYPKMVGHMGVLGTQMFYDPARDLHLIVSFGSDAGMEDSVKLMITVLGIVLRMR